MVVSLVTSNRPLDSTAMDEIQQSPPQERRRRRIRSISLCSSGSLDSPMTVEEDNIRPESLSPKFIKRPKIIDSPQLTKGLDVPRWYVIRKPRGVSTVSAPGRDEWIEQSEAEGNEDWQRRRKSCSEPVYQNQSMAMPQPLYYSIPGNSQEILTPVPFLYVSTPVIQHPLYRMQSVTRSSEDIVDGLMGSGAGSGCTSIRSSFSRSRTKSVGQQSVYVQPDSDAMVLKIMSPRDTPASLTAGQSVIPEGRRNSPDVYDSVSLDHSNSTSNIYTISTNATSITSLMGKQEGGHNFHRLVDDKNSNREPPTSTAPSSPTPAPTSDREKREILKKYLTTILSCVYATFIVMLGLVVYVADVFQADVYIAEAFNLYLTILGFMWLMFLHFDIRRCVNRAQRSRKANQNGIAELGEATGDYQMDQKAPPVPVHPFPLHYSFRTGRHSGSFYLKIGAAGFCFGHLIHEGLLLSRQIIYYTSDDTYYRTHCLRLLTLILDVIHPLLSFYQLFMIFKYSNVVINRFREVARFALMHIIASNLCFWVHTIIRETVESLNHKLNSSANFTETPQPSLTCIWSRLNSSQNVESSKCVSSKVLSSFTIDAAPYLYPFTIEYSLLVVGVWFIIWHNIGKTDCSSGQKHAEESSYTNNQVIHVDCHSANRGLFAGLFVLLATVISVIIFFVSVMNTEYIATGILINNVSDLTLLVVMALAVLVAYRQTSKLDINAHAVTFLDDILLFVALPCFFLYGIFNVVAGMQSDNIFSIVSGVLSVLQVTLQTPFIIDGLRRCSNSHGLRYQKPGRELITFLVVCNLAMWILETFEIKNAEAHLDQIQVYGKFAWTALSHITLPLTLFYRFHASVCLVDIWKSAYEPGD